MPKSPDDQPFDARKFRELLSKINGNLPDDLPDIEHLSDRTRATLARELEEIARRAHQLAKSVDPVTSPHEFFDPSDPEHSASLLAGKLESLEKHKLESIARFYGSGVYALYFSGQHSAYRRIAGTDVPIYVGKAEPEDPKASTPRGQGRTLSARLKNDHLRSIRAAEAHAAASDGHVEPIRVDEFECRYLVLPSPFAAAVERALINRYEPVWATSVCDGFGKHGDRATTRTNTRSEWDTLHPGRKWATGDDNKPSPKDAEQISREIDAQLVRVFERLG